MTRIKSVILGVLLPVTLAHPTYTNDRRKDDASSAERAQSVIDAFRVSWDGYHTYAFPHDELHPVSNGFSDSRYVP